LTARGHLTIYRYPSDTLLVPKRYRLNTDEIGSTRAIAIVQMTATEIGTWEDEGGSAPAHSSVSTAALSGTASQVEWAERIKRQVNAEFDRVAASFRSVADKQGDGRRADTESIITILEDKRAEVMSRKQAGPSSTIGKRSAIRCGK
jgi:hypothetical protein